MIKYLLSHISAYKLIPQCGTVCNLSALEKWFQCIIVLSYLAHCENSINALKINKPNHQLSRIRRTDGGVLTPYDTSKTKRKKKNFPASNEKTGKDSVCEEPWTLCYWSLPLSFPLFINAFFFSCPEGLAHGSPRVQTLSCNSLLVPNEPIFAGKVFGYCFRSIC